MEHYFYINPDSAVKSLYDKVKSVIRTLTLMPNYMENLDNRADLILGDNLLSNNTKIQMLMRVYSCAADAVIEEKDTYYRSINLDICLDNMRNDDIHVDNECEPCAPEDNEEVQTLNSDAFIKIWNDAIKETLDNYRSLLDNEDS